MTSRRHASSKKPAVRRRGRQQNAKSNASTNRSVIGVTIDPASHEIRITNSTKKKSAPWKSRRGMNRPYPQQRPPKRHGATHNNSPQMRLSQQPQPLPLIHASSIHRSWKQPLGGLIRCYVNYFAHPKHGTAKKTIYELDDEIERLYFQNNCSVEATRNAMLQKLASHAAENSQQYSQTSNRNALRMEPPWISFTMVLEKNQFTPEKQLEIEQQGYQLSCDGKGYRLRVEDRPGEGPAHQGKLWKTIVVPTWAEGKSYFIEVDNSSPLPLSCEMKMTDANAQMAKNAPIPAQRYGTIRPDNQRYYEHHQWVFQKAQRVSLGQAIAQSLSQEENNKQSGGERYNGQRPDYTTQPRVPLDQYPDPITHGWTLTGTVCDRPPYVEFYEKRLNMGTCKLDFFYTTATVKTVLDHPTSGRTQLHRAQVSPETFRKILRNPRAHTNEGYYQHKHRKTPRRRSSGAGSVGSMQHDPTTSRDAEDGDHNNNGPEDANAGDAATAAGPPIYFARNDDYDFDLAGHNNRQSAMQKLQPTTTFQAWEEAARKEWACIHARFFVAYPRYLRKSGTVGAEHDDRRSSGHHAVEKELLPPTTTIVNTKAAEFASLVTEFHATGGANNHTTSRPRGNLKMTRLAGLQDSPEWGAGPVFDLKVFYRSEEKPTFDDDDDDRQQEEDEAMEEEGESSSTTAERMRDETPLADYKEGKLLQLVKWHEEVKISQSLETSNSMDDSSASHQATDQQEMARVMLENCRAKIQSAVDAHAVEAAIKVYFDWHQKQQWRRVE